LLVGARCKLFASNRDAGNSSDQNFPVKDTGPIDIGSIVLDPRGAAGPRTGPRFDIGSIVLDPRGAAAGPRTGPR
jgi:hypothetical protein